MDDMEALRYPLGRFDFEQSITPDKLAFWIDTIETTPARLRHAVTGLTDVQLETPYRPDGWTVCQVVHHMPDSHMNSYVRFKLAMTEDVPTIRPYHEDRWAGLAEARSAPVEVSLALLEALHRRWVLFLRNLAPEDFSRRFRHPDLGELDLGLNVGLYAWHGQHHIAHITCLRERRGW